MHARHRVRAIDERRGGWAAAATALALACLGALSLVPATAGAKPLEGNGRIVFARVFIPAGDEVNINDKLYSILPDGTGETRLSLNGDDFDPAWSPDGTTIAFARRTGSTQARGSRELWLMDADGSNQRRLTTATTRHSDRFPAWSADGSKLAFRSNRSGNFEIYSINADGSGVERLTDDAGFDSSPSWAPDGSRITWISDRSGNREVYVMRADGANPRKVSDNTAGVSGQAFDSDPAWSPDGRRIAFVAGQSGRTDIFAFSVATGETERITDTRADERFPAWSPDGTLLAFSTSRDKTPSDRNREIYVMPSTGGTQARVTNDLAFDTRPTWQPVAVTDPQHVPSTSPTPGGGNGGSGGETPALRLSLAGKRSQRILRRRAVVVRATCSRACIARFGGRMTVGRPGHTRPLERRTRTLKGRKRTLQAGVSARVKIKLSRRQLEAVRRGLARHRRVVLTVRVRARDAQTGVSMSAQRKVRARR